MSEGEGIALFLVLNVIVISGLLYIMWKQK